MCGVEVFDHADSVDAFRAFFSVRGKAMYPKTDVLFKMIREIINTSSLKFTTEDLIGKVIPALKHAPKMVKLGMTES